MPFLHVHSVTAPSQCAEHEQHKPDEQPRKPSADQKRKQQPRTKCEQRQMRIASA